MNPELQRNLWLEATPRKLAFAAAILAGVFAAVWLVDRGRHASAITTAGAAVFVLAALGWAPRAARSAVTGEVAAGSWDLQRLTAQTPWAMTWGKLAGATARPWAIAAGGLVLALLQLASTIGLAAAGFWLVVALGLAVTLQASGLATGLIDVRRARAIGRPLSARAPGLALLALALVSLAVLVWLRGTAADALGRLDLGGGAPGRPALGVDWFGHAWPPVRFSALTLLALAGWAVVWSWRLMRLELAWLNRPWAWMLFLAFVGVYVLGFDPAAGTAAPLARRLGRATGAWAVLAYVAAFVGPADRVRARQFAAAVRDRRLARILSHLPLTALPSALAMLAGLLTIAIRARRGETAAALGVLAALAFFGRDLGVVAWRRFATRGWRGDTGVLLCLLAFYLLGPPAGWAFARGRGAALFWPDPAHPRLTLLAGLVEAALAWGLAALAVARQEAPHRPRSGRTAVPTTPGPTTPGPTTPGPATPGPATPDHPGVPPGASLL